MAKNQEKIDLNKIISETVERFEEIRNSDDEQKRKTQKEKRLATTVKMELREDGRRLDKKRISILTMNKYLSKVREAISDLGYKHHSFNTSVTRLIKKYPDHKERFLKLVELPLKDASKDLKEWKEDLFNQIQICNDNSKEKSLRALHDHLSKLVIVPEVISKMAFDSTDKQLIKEHREEVITKKQSKLITLKMSKVINLITTLLSASVSDPKRIEKLALGVSLATGRRQIETCIQGNFKKKGKYEIKFTGQAKARGEEREITIPSLAPVDSVLSALETVRNSDLISNIQADMKETSFYTANEMFNNKSRTFTLTAKDVFQDAFGNKPSDQAWMFKDSRAIYAKTAYEMYRKETLDKGEQISSEDIFFTSRLGHTDSKAKENYKAFEVIADDISKVDSKKLVERTPKERLEGLKNLLDNDAIKQNRLEKNLERVIEFVTKAPEQNITKVWLRKDVRGGKTIRLNLLQEIIEKEGLNLV